MALKKARKFDEARALIEENLPGHDLPPEKLLQKAELLNEVRAHGDSFAAYEFLLTCSPKNIDKVRFSYSRRLLSHGFGIKAHTVLEPVIAKGTEDHNILKFFRKLDEIVSVLLRLEAERPGDDVDTRILAMKHAILKFAQRSIRELPAARVGKIALVTGTLGAGGAERQMSRLAIRLTRLYRKGESIDGMSLEHPVELIIKSLASSEKNDFFLKDVLDNEVVVHEMEAMTAEPPCLAHFNDPELEILVGHLPPATTYGVNRLVRHFVTTETDCVSIWQDGACLLSAFAAILAGVPRIQLGVRGLPPSLRAHMFRPEYEILYRALMCIPGVDFLSNSRNVAVEYGRWLGVPIEKFRIVYNGVKIPKSEGSSCLDAQWQAFAERTANAKMTIGGVFRFAKDKRPKLWIRFAQYHLAQHPESRFILVGGGDMLSESIELAEELGISHRILFVGASKEVGYWMNKMDVLVLLSRYEGLPNVLIEAQMMGIPVVTTPAGGATECFLDGLTGFSLDCAEMVDFRNVSSYAHQLCIEMDSNHAFHSHGNRFLEANFSIDGMVRNFVNTICSPVCDSLVADADLNGVFPGRTDIPLVSGLVYDKLDLSLK
jgi:glycosyltransferase involved in cell wall biosynthesis